MKCSKETLHSIASSDKSPPSYTITDLACISDLVDRLLTASQSPLFEEAPAIRSVWRCSECGSFHGSLERVKTGPEPRIHRVRDLG